MSNNKIATVPTDRWFNITTTSSDTACTLYLYGIVVSYDYWDDDISPMPVIEELNKLPSTIETIHVHINSQGGSVHAGIAIYNTLKNHPAKIHVHIDSLAASIASIIAMAGDEVTMALGSQIMIHEPWSVVAGNAKELVKEAGVLDQIADNMTKIYLTRTNLSINILKSHMEDETWYTHEDAVKHGFADNVSAMAACDPIGGPKDFNFLNLPPELEALMSAQAVPTPTPAPVPAPVPTPQALPTPAPAPVVLDEAAIKAQALADEATRRNEIGLAFAAFTGIEGVPELLQKCQDDVNISASQSSTLILNHLGAQATALNQPNSSGTIVSGPDEQEKYLAGVTDVLVARCTGQMAKVDRANPHRSLKLSQITEDMLLAQGQTLAQVRALTPGKMFMAAMTTSDFPLLLENTLNKVLVDAYTAQPDTWRQFCQVGQVSDFKESKRYGAGTFTRLNPLNQMGEYERGEIPDAEREKISISTVGREIMFSRQMLIDDDLGAFSDIVKQIGRAAARSIELDVYKTIAANGNMGDGVAMFHLASHKNVIDTGAAPTIGAIGAARLLMRKQTLPKAPNAAATDVDYADILPKILLCSVEDEEQAVKSLGVEYEDHDKGIKNPIKNIVTVVASPRLPTTYWYLLAAPTDGALEVDFLNGEEQPFVDDAESINPDGIRYVVRHDYGVAFMNWRAAVRHTR